MNTDRTDDFLAELDALLAEGDQPEPGWERSYDVAAWTPQAAEDDRPVDADAYGNPLTTWGGELDYNPGQPHETGPRPVGPGDHRRPVHTTWADMGRAVDIGAARPPAFLLPVGRALNVPQPALEDPAALAEDHRRRQEDRASFFTAVTDAWAGIGAQLNGWGTPLTEATQHLHLDGVGVLPDVPPTDPRARALHLRRTRNTGPARLSGQNAHAPRRLQ